MKKIVLMTLILVLLIVPVTVNAAFSDVPSDHWAVGFIEELSSKNVINGFPDGTFKPSDTLTYAQFIKLIISASLEGVDYDLVSSDINHWAAPYIEVAQNYRVIEKNIPVEKLDKPISRIEVVSILGRCDIEIRLHGQKSVDSLDFTDIGNVSVSDNGMLRHAVANGIIGGYPDGTFKPDNNLTRAEASKILSIYMGI